MIDTVTFENDYGEILRPFEDYGVLMVSHDAPPPTPKTYTVSLEGADGYLDMTEWAGEVRYNARSVTIKLRDMETDAHKAIMQFLASRKLRITFSEEPDYYFIGRCDKPAETTRKRVTDVSLSFTCQPWKLAHIPTIRTGNPTEQGISIPLTAARKSAIPKITVTEECTLAYGNYSVTLSAGTHTVPQIVITDRTQILTVTGSGKITLEWQDGVL